MLYYICHCVEKRTKINKKRLGLAPPKNQSNGSSSSPFRMSKKQSFDVMLRHETSASAPFNKKIGCFCEDIFKSLLLYLTCLKRVTTYLIEFKQLLKPGFVVVVKWSVCLLSTPPIRVRIRFKSTILIMYKLLEKNENKLKEAGKCPF